MGFVRGDLEVLAVVTGLVGRLSAARQARFEALRAVDAGAVAAGMQGVGAEVGARLEKHREQLAQSLQMVQRGAEEALGGCREDLVRRLHETGVTFDNKLASTAFRIRALDTQMAETADGARSVPFLPPPSWPIHLTPLSLPPSPFLPRQTHRRAGDAV